MVRKVGESTLIEQNYDKNNENALEFLSGEHYCTVSFTNRKHINRIKKIYQERKDEFKFFHQNNDGSICAKIPLKWFKINPGSKPDPNKPKREMTDEEKSKLVARLQAGRNK